MSGQEISDSTRRVAGAPTSTTARVLGVLTVLVEAERPLSASEIGREARLPRATAHRFLQLLREAGMAEVGSDGRYVPGRELHRVAALLAGRDGFDIVARDQMRALVAETGETSLLALYLPAEHRLVWTQMERGPRALGYLIELKSPATLIWGASGRAILSALPDALARHILERDAGLRSEPLGALPPTQVEMGEELATIRRRGYAVSLSQRVPHAFSIAAPVFGLGETVRGALSLTIPEMRVDEGLVGRMAPEVVARARELSHL
ncbi:MAG: IclR family transcriptional regulator, partial [Solirubrobacteraceae bacterium]